MDSWEITTIVFKLPIVELGLDLCYQSTLLREVLLRFSLLVLQFRGSLTVKKPHGGGEYLRDMCCIEDGLQKTLNWEKDLCVIYRIF